MYKKSITYLYNPQNLSKDELIDSFVVRLETFNKLFKEIKGSKMQYPEQHYLIQGKRGMGKTTLLWRLNYEIENDKDLNTWLVPLIFNEEEYGITKLYAFWERVLQLWWEKDASLFYLKAEKEHLHKTIKDDKAYESALYELFSNTLVKNGKKVILFIDNFGDLFNNFTEDEGWRLRKVLQTSADIRFITASAVMLEAFFEYKHPFYEFFKIENLRGLDATCTRELLLKLSDIYELPKVRRIVENEPGRVEALRRLTGGVIRSVMLLFEIFMEQEDSDAFKDLAAILDKVTTLYKERMDNLPAKQKEIVHFIALSWDAVSVKEICEELREESKVVSAQLNQLTKSEIIEKIPTTNKNNLYQISERFFNIWYLMRFGRRGDNRVLWLTRFFEDWCDDDTLKNRVKSHIEAMQRKSYDAQYAYLLSEALAKTRQLPDGLQHELLEVTRNYLTEAKVEYVNMLSKSDKSRLESATNYFNDENYENALQECLEMKNLIFKNIAVCYYCLENYEKAEEYFKLALEKGENNAAFELGQLYRYDIKDYKKAEEYLKLALEKGENDATLELGKLYRYDIKDYEKAEEFLTLALEKGENNAAFQLGILYRYYIKDYEKAEGFLTLAVEKNENYAILELGKLYSYDIKNHEKAKVFLTSALEKGENNAALELGILHRYDVKDYKKAEEFLKLALEKGENNAAFQLGILYCYDIKDYEKAEEYLKVALKKGENNAALELGILYRYNVKNYEKAEESLTLAFGKGENNAALELGILYHYVIKDHGKAEAFLTLAVKKGENDAALELGILYRYGIKDYEKAEEFLTLALEKGENNAALELGILYHYVIKDYEKAEAFLTLALEKDENYAALELGKLYHYGIENYEKAETFLSLALEKGENNAALQLAWLYYEVHNNINEAERLLLEYIDKQDCAYCLAAVYFSEKIKKEQALTLSKKFLEKNLAHAYLKACVFLWHEKTEDAINELNCFLYDLAFIEENPEDYSTFLLLLLAKKQYHFLYDYFTNPRGVDIQAKDRFKPIWYALMHFMRDEYPNEYLRMGDELRETVEEIIDKIAQMAIDYA